MLKVRYLLVFTVNNLFAQVKVMNTIKVLKANLIGKEFKYNDQDGTITYLKYLGFLTSDKGVKFKVMTSVWIWGMSLRATSRILIFNNSNRYLGNYYLTTSADLPSYIKNNCLVFNDTSEGCDSAIVTNITFRKGIPKKFFRKCKGDDGDIYTFGKD
jgi:hypothetical protein